MVLGGERWELRVKRGGERLGLVEELRVREVVGGGGVDEEGSRFR